METAVGDLVKSSKRFFFERKHKEAAESSEQAKRLLSYKFMEDSEHRFELERLQQVGYFADVLGCTLWQLVCAHLGA